MANQLVNGDLLAGDAATGHGILTGWHGQRELIREKLLDVAAVAEIPREWLPPVKDAGVQLGRAVQEVGGVAYLAKPVRKGPRIEGQEPPAWSARWTLVTRPTSDDDVIPGQKYGTVALVATLYQSEELGPRLAFERDQSDPRTYALVTAIEQAFEARIAQQRYTAADITKWLGDTLRRRLGAIRYGGNWYVPRETRDVAAALLDAVRMTGWGVNWMHPALPIATSAELATGLAISLQNEVQDVMTTLEQARQYARDAGRPDVGPRAVANYQERFKEIEARIRKAAHLLGEQHVHESLNVVAEGYVTLDSIRETFPVDHAESTDAMGPDMSDVSDGLERYDIG